jgi:hypothetical protein
MDINAAEQNCKKCKWDAPGDCKHPDNKDLKFWERVKSVCPHFEPKKTGNVIQRDEKE